MSQPVLTIGMIFKDDIRTQTGGRVKRVQEEVHKTQCLRGGRKPAPFPAFRYSALSLEKPPAGRLFQEQGEKRRNLS